MHMWFELLSTKPWCLKPCFTRTHIRFRTLGWWSMGQNPGGMKQKKIFFNDFYYLFIYSFSGVRSRNIRRKSASATRSTWNTDIFMKVRGEEHFNVMGNLKEGKRNLTFPHVVINPVNSAGVRENRLSQGNFNYAEQEHFYGKKKTSAKTIWCLFGKTSVTKVKVSTCGFEFT